MKEATSAPSSNLEVSHIDSIKPCQCGVQPDICFCDGGARQVPALREDALNPVQSSKHLSNCFVICLLSCGKTSSVDTIVDVPERKKR